MPRFAPGPSETTGPCTASRGREQACPHETTSCPSEHGGRAPARREGIAPEDARWEGAPPEGRDEPAAEPAAGGPRRPPAPPRRPRRRDHGPRPGHRAAAAAGPAARRPAVRARAGGGAGGPAAVRRLCRERADTATSSREAVSTARATSSTSPADPAPPTGTAPPSGLSLPGMGPFPSFPVIPVVPRRSVVPRRPPPAPPGPPHDAPGQGTPGGILPQRRGRPPTPSPQCPRQRAGPGCRWQREGGRGCGTNGRLATAGGGDRGRPDDRGPRPTPRPSPREPST